MNPEIKAITEDIVENLLNFINDQQLKDIILQTVRNGYLKGLEEAEMQFEFNVMPDQNALRAIESFAFNNVKDLADDLKKKLRQELELGLLNQEAIPKLRERIKNVFDVSITRADNIARTETFRALNMGNFQGAKDSGMVTAKEWNAQPEKDEQNPCHICEYLNGQRVKLHESFKGKDGTEYFLAPSHPRCKCRILYIQ